MRCAEVVGVGCPATPEHLDLAGVRREQALEDLDGRRLAGAVRAEQPEALAGTDLEIEAIHGDHVAVALDQADAAQGDGVIRATPRGDPRRAGGGCREHVSRAG